MHYHAPHSITVLKYFTLKMRVTELNSKLDSVRAHVERGLSL